MELFGFETELPGPDDDLDAAFEIHDFPPMQPGWTGMMIIRGYQDDASIHIYEDWKTFRSTLLHMATGLGKTVICAEVILRWLKTWGRVLFLVHRDELAQQAAESIGYHLQETVQIEMGDQRACESEMYGAKSNVIVGSVQTLCRPSRQKKFDMSEFGLVIIDEGHHAVADSYRKVMTWALAGNPKMRFLLVTATPDRADEEELGQVCESVAYKMDIIDGVKQGWLVMPKQKYVVVDELDFSRCRTTAGDLNGKDLEAAMMGGEVIDKAFAEMTKEEQEATIIQERMLHKVVIPTLAESQQRATIMFCVTVAHAERSAEIAKRYGYLEGDVVPLIDYPEATPVTAECIHGGTPKDIRREMVGRFKGGHTMLLTAVGVPTEGFDAPNCAVISVARPTKSRALYTQEIGRATRPLKGVVDGLETAEERLAAIAASAKPYATVLDFVGNSGKHSLISTGDVLGDAYPEELLEAAKMRIRDAGKVMDIHEAVQEELHDRAEIRKKRAEAEEAKRKQYLEYLASLHSKTPEQLRRDGITANAEYTARSVDGFSHQPERAMPSYRGGASDKQINWLHDLGIPREVSIGFTSPQAGAVIKKQLSLEGGDFRITIGKTHRGKSLKEAGSGFVWWVRSKMDDSELKSKLLKHIAIMEGSNKPHQTARSPDVPF